MALPSIRLRSEDFTERLPNIVGPYAPKTQRLAEVAGLLGHGIGGRPGD
jgi:hypothetical protein